MSNAALESVRQMVRSWILDVVIDHNLCPFAQPVFDRLRVEVCTAEDLDPFLEHLGRELTVLVTSSPNEVPTTVLVTTQLFSTFDGYLDALELVEAAITQVGLEDEIQVASFHPLYQFDDTEPDDPANWTNRSPWPMFHLLRTADVAAAIEQHPDTEDIPARNVEHFTRLGRSGVDALFRKYRLWDSSLESE